MIKLSDDDIKAITYCLRHRIPLPDKYRYILFENNKEVELVWNGKNKKTYKKVFPFQFIEQSDSFLGKDIAKRTLFDDPPKNPLKDDGWANKLIQGDNKAVISSLKSGPLREEIKKHGGIKLIYIDPPFDVGVNFTIGIEIGDEKVKKDPNVLSELAYSDIWGYGKDSFLNMIYERLRLMHELLSEDGSLYLHCDWHINGHIREILDEIFDPGNFINDIIWYYPDKIPSGISRLPQNHDDVFFYAKNKAKKQYNTLKILRDVPRKMARKVWNAALKKWRGYERDDNGNLIYDICEDKMADDVWIVPAAPVVRGPENLNYPTQKPAEILRRIIEMSSKPGDIVADFFIGSGTTAAVAETMGRKWIGNDLGKFAIHVARKRILALHEEFRKENIPYRPFEILKLDNRPQTLFFQANTNPLEQKEEKLIEKRKKRALSAILDAYLAENTSDLGMFQAVKGDRVVYVADLGTPLTKDIFQKILKECVKIGIDKIDVLAFEYGLGLFPKIYDEMTAKGVDLAAKLIPQDLFRKYHHKDYKPYFREVSFINAVPHYKKNSLSIELTDYSCFYSQDNIHPSDLRNNSTLIKVHKGQVVKITKDAEGRLKTEKLTKSWSDWIDYWAIDIGCKQNGKALKGNGDFEGSFAQDFFFTNTWHAFRFKQNRKIELQSPFFNYSPASVKKVAVKVIDILGNESLMFIDIKH
ncbi:MAG: site-specific DNA-methyltransferase [Deltaproteobacteria bacterium]|jgi:site-specific DNA-methyltransferase (adenine-specific)/adenine-specific DNA-methyltransferase|nr:site-specific DNA-methyltransferase [Deltaproteobacteria bacterium]